VSGRALVKTIQLVVGVFDEPIFALFVGAGFSDTLQLLKEDVVQTKA
jgi:hypothetical protein